MRRSLRKECICWRLYPENPVLVERICQDLRIHPLLAQILINRGINDSESAFRFIHPSLGDLRSPVGDKPLPDINLAVERVVKAIVRKERLVVFGDYDADGISATAVLVLFLRKVGLKVDYALPDRLKEGYGLNAQAVQKFAAQGVKIVITVDCGTSNFEEISLARRLGIDVIVLDHHEVSSGIPSASRAVVNPKRSDSCFPFRDLSGVGVVFYFLIALRQKLRELNLLPLQGLNLREYLDLVALGTIADMVPLTEENRILVWFGLKELSLAGRVGIRALREVSGTFNRKWVRADEVGFALAPRINAAGRLGNSYSGLELLLSDDYTTARSIAGHLDSCNRMRQREEEKIFREAKDRIQNYFGQTLPHPPSIVLADSGWHPGVVGVVASKLAEEFFCPVCLIAVSPDGIGRGSGRSLPGISLHQILESLSNYLYSYGGHELAAGFKILPSVIPEFSQSFYLEVERRLQTNPELGEPKIHVDAEVDLQRICEIPRIDLDCLAPYGMGNPEPAFLVRGLKVKTAKLLRSRHLKLLFDGGGFPIQAIGFGIGDRYQIEPGSSVDIIFHYRDGEEGDRIKGGRNVPDLLLVDLKNSEEEV